MKKISFADRLDDFLNEATELEVRDVAVTVATWARWKKLNFRVAVEPLKEKVTSAQSTLLDSERGEL